MPIDMREIIVRPIAIRRLVNLAFLTFLAGCFASSAFTAHAASSLEGRWSQTQPNDGKCSDCEVLIEPVFGRDGILLVTANNGWTAQIFYDRNASDVAGGVGRWNTQIGDIPLGEIFDIGMQFRPTGIEMKMRVKDGTTSDWAVTSFQRTPGKNVLNPRMASKALPSVIEQTDLDPVSDSRGFLCDNGKSLTVQYDHRASESIAVATYEGSRTIYMIQVISGSGTRFANDEFEFHTKGDDAVFRIGEQTHICDLR